MKAYKVFNPDWTCNGFQYEVGKTYEMKEEPIMCESGFHACRKVSDCFSYYSFDPNNKVAEVKLMGKIIGDDGDKQCSNKIKIVKEIKWEQMLVLANTGVGNSGNSNSGNSNSGDWNSGNWNSGNWNSGNWNSGVSNSGNWNSGVSNSGNWNSGNWNSGFFNSITPDEILVFNKPCKRKIWDECMKPDFILFDFMQWVNFSDMTDTEKKAYPKAEITGGYLESLNYKKAWKKAFDSASREDIKLLKALPNFDADIFEEITGIRIQ